MTSGAIQHGVPTNVFRTLFLVMSPPVAKKALTPKSRFEIKKYINIKLHFKSHRIFEHKMGEVWKKKKKNTTKHVTSNLHGAVFAEKNISRF